MHPISRRALLLKSGLGLGGVALADLMVRQGWCADSTDKSEVLSSDLPHFAPRAKRIIFLFMHGGPSHVDTFDYKPMLETHDGKPLPFAKPRIQFAKTGDLLRSPWRFRQHGQSGAWISDLFPEVASCADDLTFIKSMHGSNEAHGGALLKIHTGSDTFVRPSMGAWLSYGLGSENSNLPSFITINPTLGHGGVQNFGSAFLPASHQATRIEMKGKSKNDGSISNLQNPLTQRVDQRRQLDLTQAYNHIQLQRTESDDKLSARIESLELAFRMQTEAPEILDISREPYHVHQMYGMGETHTEKFGKACLLARRLSESGVRFVQVSHAYWDQHSELKEKHSQLASEVDRPIAGLLRDLKMRGMLHDTLVIWGAEFGRTPTAQGKNGRDHNPHAFTYWMAGAGVKPGISYGNSDEFGFYAQENKVHVHDFHATLLHIMGLDHERLVYRQGGRDFRLTDVHGRVVHDILS